MKKKLVALVSAAILAFSMAALSGCGKTDEEIITEVLMSEFEAMKTLDEDYIANLAESAGADDLAEYGIDAQEFVKSYLDGFDYEIKGIAVDGETAAATCVVTVKSINAFYEKFTEDIGKLDYNMLMGLSDDELNKKLGSMIMDSLAGLAPVTSDDIQLDFVKSGSTWSYADGVEDAVSAALMAL